MLERAHFLDLREAALQSVQANPTLAAALRNGIALRRQMDFLRARSYRHLNVIDATPLQVTWLDDLWRHPSCPVNLPVLDHRAPRGPRALSNWRERVLAGARSQTQALAVYRAPVEPDPCLPSAAVERSRHENFPRECRNGRLAHVLGNGSGSSGASSPRQQGGLE